MYSLMLVLSLLATAAFLHVFAFGRRATCRCSWSCSPRCSTPTTGGSSSPQGLVCALVPCWWVSEVRSSFWTDALLGFGGAGLLYLPWVPTLLHQIQYRRSLAQPAELRGARADLEVAARRRHARRGAAGGRLGNRRAAPAPGGGQGAHRRARGAVIVLGTLAVAWLVSQVSPAWTTRYLGVLLGPMLLLAALGLARAGASAWSALVIILGIWAFRAASGLENKSNASDLREAAVPSSARATWCSPCSPSRDRCWPTTWRTSGGARPALREPARRRRERAGDGLDRRRREARRRPRPRRTSTRCLLASPPAGGSSSCTLSPRSATTGMRPWTQLVRRRSRRSGAPRWRPTRASSASRRAALLPPRHPHRSARRPLREEDHDGKTNHRTPSSPPRDAREAHRDPGGGPAGLTAGYLLAKQGCR